jgi:hypothetical protein
MHYFTDFGESLLDLYARIIASMLARIVGRPMAEQPDAVLASLPEERFAVFFLRLADALMAREVGPGQPALPQVTPILPRSQVRTWIKPATRPSPATRR